ncbi:MAG: hypothetical protein HQK75_18530 [Candidatus Magnetomorum sp.]|nr:hypothetical protein [Candidatus Magnetomorum sp.]
MPHLNKKEILKKLYTLFDQQVESWDIACKRSCSVCCTDRIWMTTLEGQLIVEYLQSNNMLNLLDSMNIMLPKNRYHPKTTINREAVLSVQNESVPEPDEDNTFSPCPFLTNHECPIYPVRPMGCRAMVSTRPCQNEGFAEMSPLFMSVSNVFSQYIEHIDSNGYYGNFINILNLLTTSSDAMPIQHIMASEKLLVNQGIKYMMIPPEHRLQIAPILEKIRAMGKTAL